MGEGSKNTMTSLNPLPPSKREKNRYLVYELKSDAPVSSEAIGKEIWKTALDFLGELGVSSSSLRVVDFDETKQKGIIKVNHTAIEEARMTLALVKEVEKKKVALKVLGVSGILKKARAKWF
jgi:ribonuclease P/MRP protein subunit POP5